MLDSFKDDRDACGAEALELIERLLEASQGRIVSWRIGFCGHRIASKVLLTDEMEDTLATETHGDTDWTQLIVAHAKHLHENGLV